MQNLWDGKFFKSLSENQALGAIFYIGLGGFGLLRTYLDAAKGPPAHTNAARRNAQIIRASRVSTGESGMPRAGPRTSAPGPPLPQFMFLLTVLLGGGSGAVLMVAPRVVVGPNLSAKVFKALEPTGIAKARP